MLLSPKFVALASFVASAPLTLAQSPLWGQCGGQGWTGPTTCVSGSVCTYSNPWYSQCLPGNGPDPTPTTTPTQPTTPPVSTTTGTGPQPSGTTLAQLGKSIGWKYVGGATDPGDFSDSTFVNTYTREFNAVTPVNSMKWDATERSRNSFSFGTADQLVAWAQQRNLFIRGHTCVWHSQLPNWVSSGGFNAATLTQIIQNHVTTLVNRYKGKLCMFSSNAWDVVNEIFEENGTFRRSVFYNTLGESFVEIAFRAARAVDPSAKLYINDYNTDSINSKSTALLNLVKKLKGQGVPIDGIGVQAHLIVGQVPRDFQANLEAFASAGVEVAITELDIRTSTPASSASLAQQQRDYQTVFAACKRVPACVGIQVWGLTDKYSWIPSVFPGQGAALPWDNNYNKKPAYDGIIAGIRS
ncbi:beta-1,4-endoxylanase [Panaeolus papilionaceus]|nr:beta-1,4-endoxylanase [Panaeolus papilionaceus]